MQQKLDNPDNLTLLHCVSFQGDVDKIIILLSEGADNINAVDINGMTPLHYAASEGHFKIIQILSDHGANVNLADANGKTPLHYAVIKGHSQAVKILLDRGADIEAMDSNRQTPYYIAIDKFHSEIIKIFILKNFLLFEKFFRLAVSMRNLKFIKFLIENELLLCKNKEFQFNWRKNKILTQKITELVNLETTSEEFSRREIIDGFRLSDKKSRKLKKQTIISEGPLQIFQKYPPTVADAISSQIYYEEKNEQHATVLIDRITECSDYKKAPVIAPFMYLLALATLGRHKRGFFESEKIKPLKIIITSDTNIGGFWQGKNSAMAIYPYKNTLFASSSFIYPVNVSVSAIFHESAHFAALEIMRNSCEPYTNTVKDENIKQQYFAILEETKNACSNWKSNDPLEYEIIKSIKFVFSDYEKEKRGQELFVKIAETIGCLGYERGYGWLKNHVPSLLVFYETHFNPACMAYLKTYKIWEYLALDPAFALEISAPAIEKEKNVYAEKYSENSDKKQINDVNDFFLFIDIISMFFKNLLPNQIASGHNEEDFKESIEKTMGAQLIATHIDTEQNHENFRRNLAVTKSIFNKFQEKIIEPKVAQKLAVWGIFKSNTSNTENLFNNFLSNLATSSATTMRFANPQIAPSSNTTTSISTSNTI